MAKLKHLPLVKALAVIAAILLLSQVVIWEYLPDTNPGNEHPMLAPSRGLFKSRQQRQQQQNYNMNQPPRQQQIQPQVKRHRIVQEKPAKPTANTISPYLKLPQFAGKERLLTMLHEAHFFNDSAPEFFKDEERVQNLAQQLPPWETITERLGGPEPHVIGLDTCAKYRSMVPPLERLIGVAGLFATGTNLLAALLVSNCRNGERLATNGGIGVRWQVNWGKHSPARYRLSNFIDRRLNNTAFLPVVTTRHPYSWLQSLCRQRYSTHWFHSQYHCPNLVPNEIDRYWYKYVLGHGKRGVNRMYKDPWLRDNLLDFANYTEDKTVMPVRVRYKSGTLYHESLAHMYNEWYHEYLDADFPRIIVRLEDLVFHTKKVVTNICACMGGMIKKDFQYVTQTAKVGDENIHGKHDDRTNLYKWFTKWHLEDRLHNMTKDDQAYLVEHLDEDLLKIFHYQHPVPEDA